MFKSINAIIVVMIVGLFTIGNNLTPNVLAEDNNWVTSADLRFEKLKDNISAAQLPTTHQGLNMDCFMREMIIKESLFFSLIPAQKTTVCANDTNIGVYGGGYLQLNGSNQAGLLKFTSPKDALIASNNSKNFLIADSTSPTSGGVYLKMMSSLLIDSKKNLDLTITHTVTNSGNAVPINNALGQKLIMMSSTLAFSADGDWAVFDAQNYGHVRLNLKDGTIKPFGIKFFYGNGTDPGYKTAISSDGRYAIFSRLNSQIIYDLEDCIDGVGANSHLKNCKSRQLNDERLAKTDDFGGAMLRIRFTSDKALTYFADKLVGSSVVNRQYRITIGDAPLYEMHYLGMGDSFASGEGAYNYKPYTDMPENMCHVSRSAYQYLVGPSVNSESYDSVACSGATTEDVLLAGKKLEQYEGQYGDGTAYRDRSLAGVIEIVDNFYPGLITQQTFINEKAPEVITISIGGNDIGFSDKIKSCILLDISDGTCFNTFEDRAELLIEINNLIPKLADTYRKLKVNNNRIYVIGYPKIIGDNGNCAVNVQFNNSEADFANKLTELLNDGIETAAKRAGVVYVDIEESLSGYRLCEKPSDEVFVHGVGEGLSDFFDGDGFRLVSKESLHPKQSAHIIFANQIISQTDSLGKPMPIEQPEAGFPFPSFDQPFWQVEKTNRSLANPIYWTAILDEIEKRNEKILVNLNESNFTPNSLVKVELHSTPVSLGSFTTDGSGNLSLELTIPTTVEPGYHSIHFYGTSQTGQSVDVYDYFFVGVSETDFDGDGVLDKDEGCVYVTPIGTDTDQDGIDDACDGVVDPLPEPEEEVIIDVPVISPTEPPKDIDGNGETVAGNEEMVAPGPQPLQSANSSQVPAVVAVNTVRNIQINEPDPETTPQVLSETVAVNNDARQVTVPQDNINDKPTEPVTSNSNVYKYYLLVGILAFTLLVTFLLLATKKRKKQSS